MKGWLHVLAALAGIGVALAIVLAVFGAADREGSTAGDKPPPGFTAATGSGSTTGCGSVPAGAPSAASIARAKTQLPAIYDSKQQQVVVQAPAQVTWFAALHASLGLCTEEVDVYGTQISVSAVYPASVARATQNAYAWHFLAQSFAPPLARALTQLKVVRSDKSVANLLVTQSAYRAFVAERAHFHLPMSLAGLSAFAHRAGYSSHEVNVVGF